ncbi:hypothetical protein ACIGB8_03875 [Promicromonospora sukumoe]|uniref:hypothetical protein n=1 Tax=Promicromonospora sukumoe TaxID=88382 RepID=UPI0037C66D10
MSRSTRGFAAALASVLCLAAPTGAIAAEADPLPVATSQGVGGSATVTYDDGGEFTWSGSDVVPLAGTFDWTATFDHSVISRDWVTSRTGTITVFVSSISNCGPYSAKVILQKQLAGGGWSQVGAVQTDSCRGQSHPWASAAAGRYRFELIEGGGSGDQYENHSAFGHVNYS